MRRLLISTLLITALFACNKDKDKDKGTTAGTATGTAAAPTAGTASPSAGTASPSAGTAAVAPTPTTPTTPPAGDSAAGPRPASVTPEMEATAEKLVVAMEGLGKDLTAAGGDCAKAATALRANAEKIKPLAAEAKKFENNNDEAAEKWFEATYGQRMMGAMGGMMQLAGTCSTDRDFQAASEEFGNAMDM